MGSLVMASMGLNGFDKGLNRSSDNEFFFNGFDRGLLCFFFFFDSRLWVASGGGGVRCV